jgi:tRNA-modifying protein YgfZ
MSVLKVDRGPLDGPMFEAVLSGDLATAVMRDVITAAGTDTVTFLHSQLSQDIVSMTLGETRWSFLLQPTGKLVGLVHVTRGDGDLVVLDTDAGNGQAVHDALKRFMIRTKCTLTLTTDVRHSALWSGRMPELIVGDVASGAIDESVTEVARVVRGFPKWAYELDESTIPNATGLVGIAVNFTKGCYVGQELVERIDSRGGNVPLHLVGIDFTGLLGPVGTDGSTDLTDSTEAHAIVGALTSVVADPRTGASVALAYVKRDVDPGQQTAAADGTVGTVRELAVVGSIPERPKRPGLLGRP